MTQGNLLNLYSSMADLPSEDRRNWLLKALHAGSEAYTGFERSQQRPTRSKPPGCFANCERLVAMILPKCGRRPGWAPPPDWLLQDEDVSSMEALPSSLQEALSSYIGRKETAEKAQSDPTLWQAAAEAGEAVLAALPDEPGTSELLAELKKDLASVHNRLGSALDGQSDKAASLTAFERAIALSPILPCGIVTAPAR